MRKAHSQEGTDRGDPLATHYCVVYIDGYYVVIPRDQWLGLAETREVWTPIGGYMTAFSHAFEFLWKFLAGFAAGFTFKSVLVWHSNRTTVRQSGNIVGGNLAGGDVNIRDDRRK